MSKIIILLFLLAWAAGAQAHDLLFQQDGEQFTLMRAHEHADAGSGNHGTPPAACPDGEILALICLRSDAPEPVALTPEAIFTPSSAPAALMAAVSSGCWTKTPDGTFSGSADAFPSALSSWRSFESTKLIRLWHPRLSTPLSGCLEITPLNNPLELRKGQKIRLVVTRDHEPVSGAIVLLNDRIRGETDAQGHISLKLRVDGLQTVAATLRLPLTGGAVDTDVHTTRLEFRTEVR